MDNERIGITLENHTVRLNNLESQVEELANMSSAIQELTLSVNRLAVNMENMLTVQQDQNARLHNLERVPAENWNTSKKAIITSIISALCGAAITGLLATIIH